MWVSWCLMRWHSWMNRLPHSIQLKGFSPVWILWCLTKFALRLNVFWHQEHWCSLISWWARQCILKSELHRKLLPHCWHVKGFSLVWTLWCLASSEGILKLSPHCWHLKGLCTVLLSVWATGLWICCWGREAVPTSVPERAWPWSCTLCLALWFCLQFFFLGSFVFGPWYLWWSCFYCRCRGRSRLIISHDIFWLKPC